MQLVSQSTGESKDQNLLTAYDSKIVKESSAAKFVYNADDMREAHKMMEAHVSRLEATLEASRGSWVLGSRYTLANIMWTNSLYRLKWLGMGHFWEESGNCARVQDYTSEAFARPSFRRAVIHWPMAYSPSPHVNEFRGPIAQAKFFWQMIRRRPI